MEVYIEWLQLHTAVLVAHTAAERFELREMCLEHWAEKAEMRNIIDS